MKTWLSDHSTDLAVRQAYASVLMQDKQGPAALEQYELILKTKDDVPDALNNVAWMIQGSNPGRALALAGKAWQLAPNLSEVADTYGFLLLKKGDGKTALPVLQRAHALKPADADISYHLAMALNATGKKDDAKTLLKATLAKGDKFESAADAKKLLGNL
jgi:Flp pilus assembly protein TadD